MLFYFILHASFQVYKLGGPALMYNERQHYLGKFCFFFISSCGAQIQSMLSYRYQDLREQCRFSIQRIEDHYNLRHVALRIQVLHCCRHTGFWVLSFLNTAANLDQRFWVLSWNCFSQSRLFTFEWWAVFIDNDGYRIKGFSNSDEDVDNASFAR